MSVLIITTIIGLHGWLATTDLVNPCANESICEGSLKNQTDWYYRYGRGAK